VVVLDVVDAEGHVGLALRASVWPGENFGQVLRRHSPKILRHIWRSFQNQFPQDLQSIPAALVRILGLHATKGQPTVDGNTNNSNDDDNDDNDDNNNNNNIAFVVFVILMSGSVVGTNQRAQQNARYGEVADESDIGRGDGGERKRGDFGPEVVHDLFVGETSGEVRQ